ncbi:hypothetical protein [Microbulbifer litoralis]|uniref:hypothetical protein n=1 Tax=Microbulbifer litoralis TaxID=2933965 RepID=UPI00202820A4|nr:hypothetical protein [Microbulbifer sp. GX H0434]
MVLAKESTFYGSENPVSIVWTLPGIVEVGNGSGASATPSSVDHTVLQIEAGAQIAGAVDSNSGLLISRGASIDAVGTAQDPIVFSSLDDNYSESGEWGGLVIAGFGQSNDCPNDTGSCEMEGVAAGHYFGGGLADSYSSSTLRYVVIAEGGHVIEDGNEINGLTLYAVDDANATIENVHVHNNADDGIEFFGGDAEVDNLWLTCNEDDSVDWDTGFHGSIENLSILQGGAGASNLDSAGYAFELAGNPNDPSNQPQSNGSVTNASITLASGAVQTDEVFRLKEGTLGSFTNIDISGYAGVGCDDIDANSSGSFSSLAYDCNATDLPAETSATGFTSASFWSAPACD